MATAPIVTGSAVRTPKTKLRKNRSRPNAAAAPPNTPTDNQSRPGTRLLNEVVDVSRDFRNFSTTNYLADRPAQFDPGTASMDWSALELVVYSADNANAQSLVCLPSELRLHKLALTRQGDQFRRGNDPLAGKVKWTIRQAWK